MLLNNKVNKYFGLMLIIYDTYCGPPDIIEAIKLIEWRAITVDDLITHRLPLTDIIAGFYLLRTAGNPSRQ